MMGHRYKARNGYEHDCVGAAGHRWRDHMAKNAGTWKYTKRCMSRRIRRENDSRSLYILYEELQRVDGGAAPAAGRTDEEVEGD